MVTFAMKLNVFGLFRFVIAYGAGQLTILKSPDAVLFNRADRLDGKHLGLLFSAVTGHSISESVPLKVQFTSPFSLAQKICLVNIDGAKEFIPQGKKPKCEMDVFGSENSIEAFTDKCYEEGSSVVHLTVDGLETVCFKHFKQKENYAADKRQQIVP